MKKDLFYKISTILKFLGQLEMFSFLCVILTQTKKPHWTGAKAYCIYFVIHLYSIVFGLYSIIMSCTSYAWKCPIPEYY